MTYQYFKPARFSAYAIAVIFAVLPAVAEEFSTSGNMAVFTGSHLVVHRGDAEGRSVLVSISPTTGEVVDALPVSGPEFSAVPMLDAGRHTVVLGGNGHEPKAPMAEIVHVAHDGTLSLLRKLHRPQNTPCFSMTFALEGPEEAPHLTVLCQEGSGTVLVSEGDWPHVTLSTAFRFPLQAETVLGTAVISKRQPRSALVAMREMSGLEGWALASLTEGDRVSPLVDGKAQAPVRVIAGDHPRLDRLILTGDPGLDATIGFDFEGQGGWRFQPPLDRDRDIALLADIWRNWLVIGWAAPGTSLPFAPGSAEPMQLSLYDLSRIVPEKATPVTPLVTLEPPPISRIWMGNGALVYTTSSGVIYQEIDELVANKP